MINHYSFCKNLEAIKHGRWKLKPGLTEEEINKRKLMDEEIRVTNGWARSLIRNDSRYFRTKWRVVR